MDYVDQKLKVLKFENEEEDDVASDWEDDEDEEESVPYILRLHSIDPSISVENIKRQIISSVPTLHLNTKDFELKPSEGRECELQFRSRNTGMCSEIHILHATKLIRQHLVS